MTDQAAETVLAYCKAWAGEPEAMSDFFAEDAVWTDGARGPFVGRAAIHAELMIQRSIVGPAWVEVRSIVSDGRLVMTERLDTIEVRGAKVVLPVAAAFEIGPEGKIMRWQEYYDTNTFLGQLAAQGITPQSRAEGYDKAKEALQKA